VKSTVVMLIAASLVGAYAYAQTRTEQEDRVVAKACKADADHLCSGKTGQQMTQCLKTNQAQLSANCKEAVSKLPPKS